MTTQLPISFRTVPLIDEIKAWDKLHTSGRAREIKRLELLIANFNGDEERARVVRRYFLNNERRSGLMEGLLQAVRVAGCEDRWHAEHIQTSLKNSVVATTLATLP